MKEAYIFDIDDTLIHTNSHMYVYDNHSNLIDKINSRDYVHKRNMIHNFYHKNNYKVCSDEFGDDEDLSYSFLLNGHTLDEQLEILKKVMNKNHIDVYIVTGRANSQESIQKLFQEKFNIHIQKSHIYPVSNKKIMNEVTENIIQNYGENIQDFLSNGRNSANFKKNSFFHILSKNYNNVYFYDDDPNNIQCFDHLVEDMNKNLSYSIVSHSFLIH